MAPIIGYFHLGWIKPLKMFQTSVHLSEWDQQTNWFLNHKNHDCRWIRVVGLLDILLNQIKGLSLRIFIRYSCIQSFYTWSFAAKVHDTKLFLPINRRGLLLKLNARIYLTDHYNENGTMVLKHLNCKIFAVKKIFVYKLVFFNKNIKFAMCFAVLNDAFKLMTR